MATPIGHTLVAGIMIAATGNRNQHLLSMRWLLFGAILSLLPDLDIVPDLLFGTNIHHGPSHSFVVAIPVAVLAAGISKSHPAWFRDVSFTRLLMAGFLFYSSHLAVDLVTLDNGSPFGMPLLWPILAGYADMPFYLIPNVLHSADIASTHNLNVIFREVALFGLPLVMIVIGRIGRIGLLGIRRFAMPIAFTAYLTTIMVLFLRSNPYY